MKKRHLLLTLLTVLLPLASWADVWQDPETKVNYEYTVGESFASVKAGRYSEAGSPEVSGNIAILSKFTVDGNEYNVTSIGGDAFYGCSGLTSVTIPESVTSIDFYAFYGCSGLTSVTIPSSVTSIGSYAFCGCSGLTSIAIPSSVTSIGSQAFYDCSGLTSITIPESVTSIGSSAFAGCSGLTSISVEAGNPNYDSRDNCNAIIRTSTNELVTGCATTVFPSSVTSIGDMAFCDCSGLTSITIPSSVTSIGDYAFIDCSSLASVTISEGVRFIGKGAFYRCSGLTSVTIPESVTSIGSTAFYGTGWYNNQPDGLLYLSKWLLDYKGDKPTGDIVIEEGTRGIANHVFFGCIGLTSVTIPESITSIGSSTFDYCSGLTSITINCATVGSWFCRLTSILNVTLGEGVTTISSSAFYNCTSLTNITIPSSVTSIGSSAFLGTGWYNNQPDGLLYLDKWFLRYKGDKPTGDIVIEEGTRGIADDSFYGCSGLTSVTIPSSVTSIGNYAFTGCSGLTSVTSLIEEPFAVNCFDNTIFNNAILFIPPGRIEAYISTDGWKNFENIIQIGEDLGNSLVLSVLNEDGTDVTDNVNIVWYDADGKEVGTGKSLNGIMEGTELYFSVVLDESMGRVYREVKMQKVLADGEPLTCRLEKIGRVMLEGRVSATDIDKNTMTVSVKQMLNGKWEQSYTTQTNEQGVFNVEVYDDETDITISGDGYLNTTLHRDGFGGNGNVGTIPVSLISGFAIAANITMQKAVPSDETEEITSWTDGLNNIDFTLINSTKGTTITDFTVQNGNVIIKSGASVGDEISLTAKSKQGIFADATTSFTIADGANSFDLQLTELGGMDAICAGSNNGSTSGYLYNSNDVLVAKGSYVGETLSLHHINSGVYTLVSMGNSMLLGGMTRLSDLSATGLSEGTDYVSTRVEVVDGEVTAVSVSEVPRLNETQFFYTNNNTYFSANMASVTAGNYLILQAHVDFKPEYAGKANSVTLTIDLPEGCQMVENSVIANRQAVPHTVNGNRVTMTLNEEQYGSQVCFCIIPTLNQIYTVTAMASFDINGQVTQPIGTVQFEAKGLSLSTPKYTASTNITINGTAKGYSEVSIYDNDVLIGKTSSKANGSWTAECELYNPDRDPFHEIYAKITTDPGMELTTETRLVEYVKNMIVPQKVTMTYYNGWYMKNFDVEFNLLENATTPSSYQFYTGTDFTFLADFTRNDSTQIKDVNIKVLNSDGTVRTLPATFDGKQNKWVATTKYSSSSRLPRNVTVEYDYFPIISENDYNHDEGLKDVATIITNCANKIEQYVQEHADIELVSESDNKSIFNCKMDSEDYIYQVEEIDYAVAEEMMSQYQFIYTEDEEGIIGSYTEWDDNMIKVTGVDITQRKAYQIYYSVISDNPNNSRKRVPVLASIIGGHIMEAFGLNDYLNVKSDMDNMVSNIKYYTDSYIKIRENISKLIFAKCPNGEFKLNSLQLIDADGEMGLIKIKQDVFEEKYYKYIGEYKRRLLASLATEAVTLGLSYKISAVFKSGKFVWSNANKWIARHIRKTMHPESSAEILSNSLGIVLDGIEEGTEDNKIFDYKNFNQKKDYILSWSAKQHSEILSRYTQLREKINKYSKRCEKEEDLDEEEEEEKMDEPRDEKADNNDDFRGDGSTALIDPSGYVYEAVESNRIEGVTTTCYQQENGQAVVWNAEDYSQENPLKTDATGFYRWDVPQGMWQVKYEKEGYETAYSEWLPVPPPQLDVNIGLKQSTPPTVKQMRGYESGINIEMAKYMRPETMTTQTITVTRNGSTEKGNIELLNAEKAPLGGETYVSKVRFVPQSRFNTTDLVVVTVHKDVESYCGVKMPADHVETVKIEPEIKNIVADSVVTVPYQGTRELRVLVLPKDASAGKTLHVKSSSSMIASVSATDIAVDQSGAAMLTLGGELPGGAVLDFSIDGSDVTATSKVKVVIGRELVATPVASIPSGELVEGGAKLVLTCATDGATIYYTLDGSCPCDKETRHKYDGPITIATNVVVKAIAVKDGMDDSDIATFIYIVNGINDMKMSKSLKVTYADGQLTITGAEGGTVRVFDLLGRELYAKRNAGQTVTVKVPQAESYIVSVTTADGKTVVRKVTGK